MSKIQYLIENIDAPQFYLVEHVIENAIQNFCENADIDQSNLIDQYVDLLSQSKMDLALESKLSKEILPYLEAYVDIYSPFLFQDLEESKSEFNLADYRSKVGKDVVLEFFKNMKGKLITLGSIIATAATTTWAVKNPEEIKSAVDTITAKLGGGDGVNAKVANYVRHLFGLHDVNSVPAILKRLADKQADVIEEILEKQRKMIKYNINNVTHIVDKLKDYDNNIRKIISNVKNWGIQLYHNIIK